ncbi:MAG: polymorphic toxin-type HINT domain-containing protein [Deferrisomatales bacterium]|nr:polymorphic toxin-type HINT domain-containing protein [Deferrisomatales bacterium]
MDGSLAALVSGAEDPAGNPVTPGGGGFAAELDATPPANPAASVSSTTCSTATLTWSGYAAPGDLAGFQLYRSDAPFTSVDGRSFAQLAPAAARSATLGSLSLDTTVHLAVAATDRVGNVNPGVVSQAVRIDQAVPPPVAAALQPAADPSTAVLIWPGYATADLCGFAGFEVYQQETTFTSVAGLTPVAALDPAARAFTVPGLDRSKTYFFAVVGVNRAGARNPAVTPVAWSDPYAGEITADATVGGTGVPVVDVLQAVVVRGGATLTVVPGTTLRFAAGASLAVEAGALVAEGTALAPVVFTSAADRAGGTPAPGDWPGLTLGSGAAASRLKHVFVRYGSGLTLDGVANPTVEAFTAEYNQGAGLTVANGASLTTAEALLRFNTVGARVETGGALTLTGSVVRNNTGYNGSADGSGSFAAAGNWWGAVDAAGVAATVTAGVDTTGFLDYEPVLTPALAPVDGRTQVGARLVNLALAGRNAEEMRLSEDSTFAGVFYGPFAPVTSFLLSATGGEKTLFAQFRSPTGHGSAALPLTLTYVTEGPVIQNFSVVEGQLLGRPLPVTGQATAALGLTSLAFSVDGTPVAQTAEGSLSLRWDVRPLASGVHRVQLLATDTAGNAASLERNVVVSPAPPPAPALTAPADGTATLVATVAVTGTTEPLIPVRLRRNGAVVATPTAGADGAFAVAGISLAEGANTFVATAEDAVGVSPSSNPVTVTLDSGPPAAPVLVSATAVAGRGVDLLWRYADTGERPTRFRLYRAAAAFAATNQATLLGAERTGLAATDPTPPEGTYYYGLVGLDGAGNGSTLSNVLSATYDGTPPSFSVAYAPTSPVGPGDVAVTLTASEVLAAAPSFTVRPSGSATPVTVGLTRTAERTYTGTLAVTAAMGSGNAAVAVSGRDPAGNLFSGTPAGPALSLDTRGPAGALAFDRVPPVQVTGAVSLGVTLTLDEAAKVFSVPQLTFTPPAGAPVTVALVGAGTSWSGTLPLTPAVGSGLGEFGFSAEDALGNPGTTLTAGATLELYNTATPEPTAAPATFAAVARTGGEVALSWSRVDLAETYRVYRSSGPCGTPAELLADALTTLTSLDLPAADGTYCYGVAAERRGAESPLSTPSQADSDRLPPGAPENLAVSLAARGVSVTWTAPPAGEVPAGYAVYRDGAVIGTVAGGVFSLTDYPGLGGSYVYAVASRDAVGNQSLSAPVTFDLLVGAVTQLEIFVDQGAAPLLSWQSADSAAVGFNVYRGGLKLNAAPLAATTFDDATYAGSSRVEYAVRAVNGAGQESPARVAWVYPVALQAAANPDAAGASRPLIARYFNNLAVSVANGDATEALPLGRVDLRLTADGVEQFAQSLPAASSLAPGGVLAEVAVVPVAATDRDHLLRVTAVQRADGGVVTYQRHFLFSVVQPGGMVDLKTRDLPLAGGYSDIELCTTNLGYADADIVVNRASGAEPGDLYVAIFSADGLELSRAYYQGYPPGTWTSSGVGYVTLAPGAQLCVDVQILVPAALTEGAVLTFTGVVEQTSHALGAGALASAAGLHGSMQSGITFAPYSGTAAADRDGYADDAAITITGQALDRLTGLPKANVPLKVGFLLRGYKWFADVATDGAGNYTYVYQPGAGLSGEFTVWAAHPDVYDSIDQDRFTLYRLYSVPARGDIRSAKNDTLSFRVALLNPGGVTLTGFASAFRAYTVDADSNEVPEPLLTGQAAFPAGFTLKPGERREVDLQLTAAIDAPDAAGVEYTFTTAEGASVTFWGAVTLAPAIPILTVENPSLGWVEVSLDRGSVRAAQVTLRNQGLRDLNDAELSLPENVIWMSTNLPRNAQGKVPLGTIPVGGSRTVDVLFSPPADEIFGYHRDKMVVTGSNAVSPFDIHLFALVTSDQTGSVLFNVVNHLGQKVSGATVRLRNTAIRRDLGPVTTDDQGAVTVAGLQEGDWSYQISAAGHSTVAGMTTVAANQTVLVEAFPVRSLVTVTFRVEPVPFTDRYEIKIEQTFETHVPSPVLVIDPPRVAFQDVRPGFETFFTARATNHGMISIFDLTIEGTELGNGRLEPLITYLPELKAQQTIEVPFRLTYTGAAPTLPGGAGSAFAHCMTGGLFDDGEGGLGNDLVNLAAAFAGRAPCYYTPAEAGALLGVAAGLYATLRIASTASTIAGFVTAPLSIAASVASCLASALGYAGFTPPFAVPLPSLGPTTTFTGGPGGACFAPGTPVLMADGSLKSIETVAAGDRVLSFDGEPAPVTDAYLRETDHLRDLRYRVAATAGTDVGELRRLLTTDEHLFWVLGRGWTPARALGPTDTLLLPDAGRAQVASNERTAGQFQVYNLDVAGYRSYFANGALVHQRCGGAAEEPLDERLRAWAGEAEQSIQHARTGGEGSR